MTWYKDLESCDYFRADAANSLSAVGWLEKSHDFTKGNVDQEIYDRLCELFQDPFQPGTGVIFISNKEYQESFTVKLLDRETRNKLEYYVQGLEGHFTSADIPSDEPNKIETNKR